MCGIAGVVHSNSAHPVSSETVQRMCDRIVHRGPDDYGSYVEGSVGIGMRRLSIIDLAGGKQPIPNEDRTVWVILNGEIYNYKELKRQLEAKGHRFATVSDTEVIVHLYEEYGADCVTKLRGMFGFAVWDIRQQTLMLARDRVGIKPLYYAELPGGVAFASELKSMLTLQELPRGVSAQAVVEYVVHLCVPGELSIVDAVKKLLPAHRLLYRSGRVSVDCYWRAEPQPDFSKSESEWIEEVREQLRDAVESHMVADVPVGAFLSGGLDSGSLVALMAKASAEPVRTFTVGLTTEVGDFDERAAARIIANQYRTKHEECLLAADVSSLLPSIVASFDEPFADSSAIPNWLVCRETVRHVKVALSGLGGDELFGGYERYVGLQMGEWFRWIPAPLRSILAALAGSLTPGDGSSPTIDRVKRFMSAAELPLAERYFSFIAAFATASEILHPDVLRQVGGGARRYREIIQGLKIREPLDVALTSDLNLYLPDDLLTLSDRVSMAHSLEVRVPFVDHQLIECLFKMPARYKVCGFQKKVLFKKIVRDLLPPEHFTRPKQGFSIPLAYWLRGSLKPMLLDVVGSRAAKESQWFDWGKVKKLVDEHVSGQHNHEIRLWGILCFQEWIRQYLEANPSPASKG
ncbi:MAG: asparagine synthase (glutamine-hydrolyzing) [Nitrospira sp.]